VPEARTVSLPDGRSIPALGLGTWHMGESKTERKSEADALRAGIELGLTVIDTAEMYANGGAEEVVADAIAGIRDRIFLVSKVLPSNASRAGTIAACERSLKRLRTEHIDLYLLHWRGSYELGDTVEAFERLKASGKIGSWGVSNFDTDDMEELRDVAAGVGCQADQVLYHAASRGIEHDLLPYCQQAGIVTMAYCPLGQGKLLKDAAIGQIARKHGMPTSAVALAWLLRQPNVLAIPKSANVGRVREFAQAFDVTLDAAELAEIDIKFPPPRRKAPLDMS
jgi:diketogulonate reductase-like aldo/keto reductase